MTGACRATALIPHAQTLAFEGAGNSVAWEASALALRAVWEYSS